MPWGLPGREVHGEELVTAGGECRGRPPVVEVEIDNLLLWIDRAAITSPPAGGA